MTGYTYKVVPAPAKGRKAPGVKGAEARFAHGLEEAINDMARQGWEYQRADILPSEERHGLTSTHTVYRTVLIFRRPVAAHAAATDPRHVPPLVAVPPEELPEAEADAPAPPPARQDPPLSAAPAPAMPDGAEELAAPQSGGPHDEAPHGVTPQDDTPQDGAPDDPDRPDPDDARDADDDRRA